MLDAALKIETNGDCGATVSGVDLAHATDQEIDALRQALFDHGVLFFRRQSITPEQHIALAERFAPEVQTKLRGMKAVHSSAHIFGEGGAYAQSDQKVMSGSTDLPETIHPVIIRHPGSGKPVLYVNPAFTIRFEGMTRDESLPLLMELYAHAISKDRVHTFVWEEGSVAIWDNRASWHFAKNDYHGHYRLMHRITLQGEALEAA